VAFLKDEGHQQKVALSQNGDKGRNRGSMESGKEEMGGSVPGEQENFCSRSDDLSNRMNLGGTIPEQRGLGVRDPWGVDCAERSGQLRERQKGQGRKSRDGTLLAKKIPWAPPPHDYSQTEKKKGKEARKNVQ